MKKQFRKIITLSLVICLALSFFVAFNSTKEVTRWLGAWNASATNFTSMKSFGLFNYNNQTIRTIVTSSFGGSKERIKFSNEYGTESLDIGAASVALANSDGTLKKDSKKTLTFNGNPSVTIVKGTFVWSDPIEIDVKALDKVAVSTYLPKEVKDVTGGCGGVQPYYSQVGNFTDSVDTAKDFKPAITSGFPNISPFLTSIEVITSEKNGSIIAFGDSITTFSWTEYLTKQLNDGNIKNLSVIREAIAGNRILHDTVSSMMGVFGASGVSRFEKSITDHEGAKYVVVLEGLNDIMSTGPGGTSPAAEFVSKDQIISGLQQYIELAHKHNLKIYGATIMPFEGYVTYTAEEESRRQAVNDWIRNSRKFDAVIEFDKATLDPSNPTKLLPQYDSGDHIHPSDAGSKAMAKAVDLKLFK
ncbi:SGNH/GDSL hydrolase family protein [Clostridium sp. CF011]|uniref:SGNH/GDSL hydrolase family protein n=1 Tax=Clostridium sp. CF011 TaxID=2843318 RepID=UPI001C0DB713|nr:SGNH/GDSL hydrolase family protein [Clostridium sp. CF011]MBU3093592.1 SGNH/GDSL hydrolase family protein [Clostridium sp. CF011]WAG71685.1 SGNH/GDSL hydrolase family protein [Clostridium sp. CF011]